MKANTYDTAAFMQHTTVTLDLRSAFVMSSTCFQPMVARILPASSSQDLIKYLDSRQPRFVHILDSVCVEFVFVYIFLIVIEKLSYLSSIKISLVPASNYVMYVPIKIYLN